MSSITQHTLHELSLLTVRDLNLDSEHAEKDLQGFKDWLGKAIIQLMDEDMNTLVNALYRIDISEEKAKIAFKGMDHETIAQNLAQLIIDRQLQKIELRRRYS